MVTVSNIKVFRGSNNENFEKPIMWFSVDKKVAEGYAQHYRNSTVKEYNISKPLHLVDLGRAEEHTSPVVILSSILRQSKVRLHDVQEEAFSIKQSLSNYSGSKEKDKIIFNLQNYFVDALNLFKCDGFVMTEDGHITYGILKGKL